MRGGGDVAVDNCQDPAMIQIHLKKSKTQQFGPGVYIVLGITRVHCQLHCIEEVPPGPFFLGPSKMAITKFQFISRIRSILQLIGLPQFDYTSHSFRMDAAKSSVVGDRRYLDPDVRLVSRCTN